MSTQKRQKRDDNQVTYKGRPLVRKGDELFYGYPGKEFIIHLTIEKSVTFKDLKIATKVTVQLQRNDPQIRHRMKTIKTAQRNGLYKALDVGLFWLEEAISSKKENTN